MPGLTGRIALVTGAGSGLGRAMSARFAAEGAVVYVTDVDLARAEATVSQISATGSHAVALGMNVVRGQDVQAAFRRVMDDHGKLDILVNNAGVNVLANFHQLSDAEWEKIRDVNLDGVVRVARDGFHPLKASGRGSLINVASIMGTRGLRQLAAYSATKGAVLALSQALAIEYAPYQIRVNALAPGFVETAMTERALKIPPFAKALVERTALKRLGTPEEIAGAAYFLASDDSSYMTGSTLTVDGGMSAGL